MSDADAGEFVQQVLRASWMPPLVASRDTYDDLVATGNLAPLPVRARWRQMSESGPYASHGSVGVSVHFMAQSEVIDTSRLTTAAKEAKRALARDAGRQTKTGLSR